MAIKLMKVNNSFNIYTQHFYIDNISDLDTIEDEYKCQMGDIAELPDGAKYRRHSDDYSGNLWEYYTGGGGGSELPAVTSVDNGKILKVVEGQWNKSEQGNIGNGYDAVFKFTRSEGDYYGEVVLGTFEEVLNKVLDGEILTIGATFQELNQIGESDQYEMFFYVLLSCIAVTYTNYELPTGKYLTFIFTTYPFDTGYIGLANIPLIRCEWDRTGFQVTQIIQNQNF